METVIMHAYDIMYYNERADLLVETFYGKNAIDAMNKFKQNHPTFEIWDCYSAE